MDFGSIDPAALIIALIALFVGLESILHPLCNYVRIPRQAYTEFYRDSMIFSYGADEQYDHDWLLSLAVSKAASTRIWTWNNYHAYALMDSPIGFGQWILYRTSQSGSGILTAFMLLLITPIWAIKIAVTRLMLTPIKSPLSSQKGSVWLGELIGLEDKTPMQFHLHVVANIIKVLHTNSSLYGSTAQELLSSLALSHHYVLGPATLAFSAVGSSGIWTGVWYDLSKYGVSENTNGFLDVTAGNVRLSLHKGTFVVDIPQCRASVGCSKLSKHKDTSQMIRILLSHGVTAPIDQIISNWGITQQQLYQVRFTLAVLSVDKRTDHMLQPAPPHWTYRKVRLDRKLRKLSSFSPWCICRKTNACFCSLKNIMFIPHAKDYSGFRGLLLCQNEQQTLRSTPVQLSHGIALAGGDAVATLKVTDLVIVGNQSLAIHHLS
jgi:hypothetical protein